jgi:hypothetical protein
MCSMPRVGPGRSRAEATPKRGRRGLVVIAAIVALLPVQLAFLRLEGAEPYPGLFMPSFGGVPVEDDHVVATRLRIVARSGTTAVPVDPTRLMPNKTLLAESIARFFFEDEDAVRAAAANGWLRRRLTGVGLDADTMEVVSERQLIDEVSHRIVRVRTLSDYSVALQRAAR